MLWDFLILKMHLNQHTWGLKKKKKVYGNQAQKIKTRPKTPLPGN